MRPAPLGEQRPGAAAAPPVVSPAVRGPSRISRPRSRSRIARERCRGLAEIDRLERDRLRRIRRRAARGRPAAAAGTYALALSSISLLETRRSARGAVDPRLRPPACTRRSAASPPAASLAGTCQARRRGSRGAPRRFQLEPTAARCRQIATFTAGREEAQRWRVIAEATRRAARQRVPLMIRQPAGRPSPRPMRTACGYRRSMQRDEGGSPDQA
jgi:hypothetical protein